MNDIIKFAQLVSVNNTEITEYNSRKAYIKAWRRQRERKLHQKNTMRIVRSFAYGGFAIIVTIGMLAMGSLMTLVM